MATQIGQMVTEHTPPAPQTSMGKLLSYQWLVSSFFLTDIELAIGHQRADLVARYNKDAAWQARVEAFEKVSAHISSLLVEEAPDDRSNVIAMHGRDQRPTG